MKTGLFLVSILLGIAGTAQASTTIKALSFNVWTAQAAAIARDVTLAGADIVCLQEASVEETYAAASLLGSGWAAVTPASRSEYSILSRFPVIQHLGETRIPRGGVGALIELAPGIKLYVFCHHGNHTPYGPYQLGREGLSVDQVIPSENAARGPQMNELLALIRPAMNSPSAVLLLGDFNAPSHLDYDPPVAWPISTSIHSFGFADSYADMHPQNPKKFACQFQQNDPGITWARLASEEPFGCFDRIDFIYYTPGRARPIASDTIDLQSSDHRALYTTFEIHGA